MYIYDNKSKKIWEIEKGKYGIGRHYLHLEGVSERRIARQKKL